MIGLETIYYSNTIDLWRRLCEQHKILFDLTIEEYSHLLNSDIESVERVGQEKLQTISIIQKFDDERNNTINLLNEKYNLDIQNSSDLLKFFSTLNIEKTEKYLYKFNAFLIDIIDALREQNKKNQIFLNKAISSLSEIKTLAAGLKPYTTYDSKGITQIARNNT